MDELGICYHRWTDITGEHICFEYYDHETHLCDGGSTCPATAVVTPPVKQIIKRKKHYRKSGK